MEWQSERARLNLVRLRALDLFASVGDADLALLASSTSWYTLDAGELIERPGHGGDVECIVVAGQVRLLRISEAGQILTEMEVGAGKVFDFGVRVGLSTDELVAEAVEHSVIALVPWTIFRDVVVGGSESVRLVIEQLREERRHLADFAGDALLHDVSTHIRHVLRSLALENQEHVVSITREELAARAGTSSSQVSRVLGDLTRRGLLKRHGRRMFVIRNPDDLL